MKKLNVGCGPHHSRPDWVNMDLRPFNGVDVVRDATLPFDDLGPFEFIYCEHFLEHLALTGAIRFLRNCYNALLQAGCLRLATPGLEFVVLTHFNAFETDENRCISETFSMNRAFHGWGHQFLWSRLLLIKALSAAGFAEIAFHGYGESNIEQLRGLERHGGYRHHLEIPNCWIVECKRLADTPEDPSFRQRAHHEYVRYVESGH